MAKKLILVVCLWFVLCSPALAVDFVCFEGYQIEEEEEIASFTAAAEGSGEDATTDSIIFYEFFDNYSISPLSSNYPTYEDGMISSTYMDWAKGYLSVVGPADNYVFARTGQYQYIMAVLLVLLMFIYLILPVVVMITATLYCMTSLLHSLSDLH